jgi:sugar phosphate isomerase/epimerase
MTYLLQLLQRAPQSAEQQMVARGAATITPLELTIALSAKWSTFPERFFWIVDHGFALEYTPDPEALHALPVHVRPCIEAGVPVRFHAFFPGYEMGHRDREVSERATELHMRALEAMCGLGEPVITLHVGLRHADPIDAGRVVENLTRLQEHARHLGITIALENLRRGPTSDPETLSAWARASGAAITLDIGHAVSSEGVLSGARTVFDFLDATADRLVEVHMYEQETDRHHPPHDMAILGPIVDRLLSTKCAWWTIELDDYAEALATRALLLDYLQARRSQQRLS